MKKIPILKMTSQGNNFVLLDESRAAILTEREKSTFAYYATNVNYGIGSDNFLVIQACTPGVLRRMNSNHRYWDRIPDSRVADYIFRMFEPDGAEAFSCANGLVCVAKYLDQKYSIKSARVMTEIPTRNPRVAHIGTESSENVSWVNLGHPKRIPEEVANLSRLEPYDGVISTIKGIQIRFRKHDLAPLYEERSLELSGHLVFTGEPHLVIFADTGLSLKELSDTLFIGSLRSKGEAEKNENRAAFGSWLIHHIGCYMNRNYRELFPAGINVNFVKVNKTGRTIDYRCFERGIYRETLACGTGALASSFVACRLGLVKGDPIVACPYRSPWDGGKARIMVKERENGWVLYGSSEMLLEGQFMLPSNANPQDRISNFWSFPTSGDRGVEELSYDHLTLLRH